MSKEREVEEASESSDEKARGADAPPGKGRNERFAWWEGWRFRMSVLVKKVEIAPCVDLGDAYNTILRVRKERKRLADSSVAQRQSIRLLTGGL